MLIITRVLQGSIFCISQQAYYSLIPVIKCQPLKGQNISMQKAVNYGILHKMKYHK